MNFLRILTFIFFNFSLIAISAQDLSGTVTYSYEMKRDTSDVFLNIINGHLFGSDTGEFTLKFKGKESLYEAVPKLENNGTGLFNGGRIVYINSADNLTITQTEFMGKAFKIIDSLPKRNWVLSNESMKIGDYDCFKASSTYKSTTIVDSGLLNDVEQLVKLADSNFAEKTITAWYTPQLPLTVGPDKYTGLPGLILSLTDGDAVYTCTKIVLSPKGEVKIKVPNKGKKVSQLEYDEIVNQKMQELNNFSED